MEEFLSLFNHMDQLYRDIRVLEKEFFCIFLSVSDISLLHSLYIAHEYIHNIHNNGIRARALT